MNGDSNVALKVICSFMGGIIITILAAWLAWPHDLATHADMVAIQTSFQQQLTAQQTEINAEHDRVSTDERVISRIAEKLGIDDR